MSNVREMKYNCNKRTKYVGKQMGTSCLHFYKSILCTSCVNSYNQDSLATLCNTQACLFIDCHKVHNSRIVRPSQLLVIFFFGHVPT
jgi:hypothetical protein